MSSVAAGVSPAFKKKKRAWRGKVDVRPPSNNYYARHNLGILADRSYGQHYIHRRGMVQFSS
jgi:hypothetical protein